MVSTFFWANAKLEPGGPGGGGAWGRELGGACVVGVYANGACGACVNGLGAYVW